MTSFAKQKWGEFSSGVEGVRGRLEFLRQITPLMRGDIFWASAAINVLLLAFPLVVLQVYDRILPNESLSTLTILSLGLVVALILDVFLKVARSYIAGWAGANFEHQVGQNGIEHLLKANLEDTENDPPGVHLDRLSGVDIVKDFYTSQASLVMVDMPFVIVFVGVLFAIAGWLALLPVFLLIVFPYIALGLGKDLRQSLEERQVWDNRRYSFIIEALNGIHTIKGQAMESLMERRYERIMEASAATGIRVSYLSNVTQNLGSIFGQVSIVAVVAIGSTMVFNGDLSIGGLAACTLLTSRSIQPVLRAMMVWSRFQSVQIAEENLDKFSTLTIPSQPSGASARDEAPLESIELDNVSFRYSDDSPFIIEKLSLKIDVGTVIGIRGANGSGKSTLLRLMMGALRPTSGRVLHNDVDIAAVGYSRQRKQIAYLPQKPVLFDGTILENITMFRNDELMDDALEISETLGLDKVVAKYADGFDTQIGATAHTSLPAGVAQRIAVARAVLGQPRLILFDEANASLDGASDTRIRDALKAMRKDAAIVIVSHRPSLLNIADERYDLADRVIWPADSFSEALRKGPEEDGND